MSFVKCSRDFATWYCKVYNPFSNKSRKVISSWTMITVKGYEVTMRLGLCAR